MKKQIVQFLLENQGMVSVQYISNVLQQPLSAVQSAIEALHQQHPGLLSISKEQRDDANMKVKIANYKDKLARSIIES